MRRSLRVFSLSLALSAGLPLAAPAQKLSGPAKGFKAAEYFGPPHEGQMQSLLEAAKVQPLNDKQALLTDSKLRTFRETGEPELVIQAPECLYDAEAKTANSAGPLRVLTADGKFSIEGVGFFVMQTNSNLVISNRVRTLIDSDVLAAPAARTNEHQAKPSPIEITSDYFEYSRQAGVGSYQRNVHVSGTNQTSLSSQKLTFHLPFEARQLQDLLAEQEVLVNYGDLQATSQSALYEANTGLVRLWGQPAWHSDAQQRQGRGDQLTIDRTNKIFRADGNAWVRMPAQTLSISSLLSATNRAASTVSPATNQFVEISSGYHEFRTNWAVFGSNVLATEHVNDQVRGTLNCELMNASYTGSNQLQTLIADKNVLLQDGTNWLSGGHAVFQNSNGVLEVTAKPAWSSGWRNGKGDVIRVQTRTNEMLVRGNASMRLPARELARAADPGLGTVTNRPPKSTTNEWAEIFCEEYTLRPELAQFRGGVYVSHPQMNWACENLTVQLPPAGGQIDTIVAEQKVVFDLRNEKGERMHGIGDKAVYTYRVSGGTTNDQVELTGLPAVLETERGTNRNNSIILDRANHQVITRGNYQITGQLTGVPTNALVLPKAKLTK